MNEATAQLLEQLGVQLTETGKLSLIAGNTSVAQAEAGLARVIRAQDGGSDVEALLNFAQAASFDPSQMEALSRLSSLSATLSNGTLSERIVNDIQARDSWVAAFKETAQFFENHSPFEIIFDPNLIQIGETDFVKRTANIGMNIALSPSEAGFGALNALLEGVERTGRRSAWGFSGWPLENIKPRTAGTAVFGGKRSFSYRVNVELYNENGKKIGRGSVALNTERIIFTAGNVVVNPPAGIVRTVQFSGVKAEDLTPDLTIAIVAVNGIRSRDISASGYMRIETGDVATYDGLRITTGNATGFANMVQIPAGTFTMGSPANERNRNYDEVQHQVTLSAFKIGRYEVTQKEYEEIMGTNPGYHQGDDFPVYWLSWFGAVEYCNKRSLAEGLTPAYTVTGSGYTKKAAWNRSANGYRLPTEAEWEYACRAGTTTAFNTGNRLTNGWTKGNSWGHTHAVGKRPPNNWGLYDMHGNVMEWCWDLYGNYPSEAQTDPMGGAVATASDSYYMNRVVRGGDYYFSASIARSAYRSKGSQRFDNLKHGLRVVLP